jgi:hypothetical protein
MIRTAYYVLNTSERRGGGAERTSFLLFGLGPYCSAFSRRQRGERMCFHPRDLTSFSNPFRRADGRARLLAKSCDILLLLLAVSYVSRWILLIKLSPMERSVAAIVERRFIASSSRVSFGFTFT